METEENAVVGDGSQVDGAQTEPAVTADVGGKSEMRNGRYLPVHILVRDARACFHCETNELEKITQLQSMPHV